jgi:2-polyprenyl-6-hydroxyphenyl methylase/3-demethylubiquinone-9 3-methyltransferase
MKSSASIANDEINRFSQHAAEWWNPSGAFQPLHKINPVRLSYVIEQISVHFDRDAGRAHKLQNLTILDVGCGGGLIAEPMARLGATVTGIDASVTTIEEAKRHAKSSGLTIDYHIVSVEELAAQKKQYDVITALEVAEHVEDMNSFFQSLSKLLKPEGLLILSTLNRTVKSFILGVVAAEYVLNWVPHGTHDWNKFIRPSELVARLEHHGLNACDLTGLVFNLLRNEFELRKKYVDVNYMLTATKA